MNEDTAPVPNSPRPVTRRDVLTVLGAGAAASLVGGIGREAGAAEPAVHSAATTTGGSRAGRRVVIDARPAPVTIDTAKTAVIVVDMQNDFGSAGGMFDRAGIDVSMIQRVVGPIAQVVGAARAEGMPVVYLKMAFRPDLSDFGPAGSPNRERHLQLGVGKAERGPNGRATPTLVRDTWGTDIVPELTPKAGDLVVYKHRFSGFFQTDLDARLRRLGVTSLIVTGCTTSVCVESTVRDAMFRDYSPIVLSDCTAEPIGHDLARSNHEASLLTIQVLLGWVSTSGAVRAALAGGVAAASPGKG